MYEKSCVFKTSVQRERSLFKKILSYVCVLITCMLVHSIYAQMSDEVFRSPELELLCATMMKIEPLQ